MIKIIKLTSISLILLILMNFASAENTFFEDGKKKYNENKLEDAKFLFQRSIVFNPKKAKSYLYLAKIYNFEKNQKELEKNINTALLLDPKNEEAVFMLIEIDLKKSNYSEVKRSLEIFSKVCKNLCEKKKTILDSLKNLEPKNET